MNAPSSPSADTPPAVRQFLTGSLLGLLVASAGAVGWFHLTVAASRMFGAVAVLIGMLTGLAVRQGIRQGGIGAGLLSAILTLGALLCVHYAIVTDVLRKGAQAQGYTGIEGLSFWEAMRFLDMWAWIFVAMGVYFGFRMAWVKSAPQLPRGPKEAGPL